MPLRHVVLAAVLVLGGCATSHAVGYQVASDPSGAQIDVNGTTLCDATPCTIELVCSKRWVGLARAPSGYANASGAYEVAAVPRAALGPGRFYSDTKRVDPCQVPEGQSGRLRFNLGLEPVAPTQPIEIRH